MQDKASNASHSSFSGNDSEDSSGSKKRKPKKVEPKAPPKLIAPRHDKHNQFFDADVEDDQFNCEPT